MAKKSDNDILDLSQDWGSDPNAGGIPFSGASVQKFIKGQLSALGDKTGDAYFDSATNIQYLFKSTDDKLAWLSGDTSIEVKTCPFEFSGTVRRMTVVNEMESKNLYYTQMSESAIITVGFKSEEKGITDTSWNEVLEDARISVEVDRGVTGSYDTIVNEQLVLNGNTFSVDVIKYLATGNNRVRVTAVGVETGSTANIVYSALLTSMYLAPAKFAWNVPFIEGQAYSLGGLYIGGNIDKVLKIKVSNEQTYSKLYEINLGTQTSTSIAYYYSGLTFPTEGTGIYTVEMWLDANGLESEHLHYNIMCIAEADVRTAQLIAVSDVLSTVKNYGTNKLFSYAVYNGGAQTAKPIVNVSAIINNTPTQITKDEELTNVPTGAINDYILDLEIDTQETNIQLYSSIELGDSKQEAVYAIDNSASYPAVAGAVFYMNPANRSNTQANKESIINESNVAAATATYDATWSNVSFTDGMDGWTVDNNGRKCLRLPAKSKVEIDYAPFANATTRTLEISYKVENASDYNEDIISVASELTSQFVGARVKPTNVLLHSGLLKTDDLMQGYNTKDEELVHLLITVIKDYKQIGNLAQIYVNGVKKCSFEWSAQDTFAHNGKVLFGSNTADLFVYKTRVYIDAFDWILAARNFVSCLPDTASKKAAHDRLHSVLNDGNNIDFDKVKNGGFNYFTLRLPNGASLPSILNQSAVEHSRLEINIQQNPSFVINGIYDDETTEGQGTTAMNYFRWNLRWKTEIIRITAKKNFASSMHSHKMGATALFNDLNRMIVGANEADARVAVEQYGAYGFLEVLKEGTTDQYNYIPIGLYTIGQDKGDKATFGYNNKDYKGTLIHLEGTDHSPKAVGMDYPWAKLGVATNNDGDDNLGVKRADGSVIAAWEIGACGSAETNADMFNYLTQEFFPAYDCDYRNTSMIVGLDAGITIDDVNSNLSAFRAMETDNGYTNADCLIWIDGEYDTYYYDVLQEKYVKDGLNILTDLGISASDLSGTTVAEKNREIRMRRMMRYRDTMENYWHLRDNLFHYCFIVLFAATDNFKKNTYPYKFGTLESGSRWRWRQDDLDTLFDINNQGLANKIYSILNGDKSGTTHLFRGNTSYHWTNIQYYYENEIKSMMNEILTAMASLSNTGGSLIEKAVGCVRKYFWDKAQDYFTKSAYNIDAEWSYEEAWAAMKNGTYAAPVHPLQQSLGSHYEAERAFVELRFIFMASLFGFGAFAVGNDSDTSLGQISFRPAQGDNTFHLTPAINMNPTILVGDSDKKSAEQRLNAGETADITISTDGDTSIYIQGTDYLSDIGDFSKINLYAENPALTVQSKRLQKLKVGDENPSEVTTVLKTLNVLSCPSLSEVDARNVSTLTGTVDLSNCPRLTKALFGGSNAGEIMLPKGSKITEFELPDSLVNLSLVNLPNLELPNKVEEFEAKLEYTGMYYYTNQGVGNKVIYQSNTDNNVAGGIIIDLKDVNFITVTGKGGNSPRLWCFVDANDIILSCAAEQAQATNLTLTIPSNAKKCIVQFMASVAYKVVVSKGKTVEGGLQYGELNALTYLRLENNAHIQGFAMLKATYEAGSPLTNIRVIGFDYDGTANDVTLLATLANGGYFGINADGSPNNEIIPVIEGTINVAGSVYEDDANAINSKYGANLVLNVTGGYYIKFNDPEWRRLSATIFGDGVGTTKEQAAKVTKISDLWQYTPDIRQTVEDVSDLYKYPNLTTLPGNTFASCPNLKSCIIPNSVTQPSTGQIFGNCTSLEKVILGKSIQSLGDVAFVKCSSLQRIVLPLNIKTLGEQCFDGCSELHKIYIGGLTEMKQYSVRGIGATNNIDIYVPNIETYLKIKFNHYNGHFDFSKTTLYQGVIDEITQNTEYGDITIDYDWDKLERERVLVTTEMVNEALQDKSITQISTFAFYGATQLEGELVIPSHITSLGNQCFQKSSISKVRFEDGITTIGPSSFANCVNLVEAELPTSVTSIANYAFSASPIQGVVNLPNLTSLGKDAFRNTKITAVQKLGSVDTIQQNAFQYCSTLSSLTLPNSVTNIESQAFQGVALVGELILPRSITKMGSNCFTHATGTTILDKLYLPNIENIEQTGNSSIALVAREVHLDDIQHLFNTNYLFYMCSDYGSGTATFYVNDKPVYDVTIEHTNNTVFYRSLRNSTIRVVKIGEGFMTLDIECFYGCPNLQLIDFPSTMTNISTSYSGSFVMVCRAVAPPTVGSLANVTTIYVPDSSVETYRGTSGWSANQSKIKPLSDYIWYITPNDVFVDSTTQITVRYKGVEVKPQFSIESDVATIDENGLLVFSDYGKATVTITYNGDSVTKIYEYSQAPIENGVALQNTGLTAAIANMSTVGFVTCNPSTQIKWGVTGGTLGTLCEYKEDGTFVDYWGGNQNPRTISVTANSTKVKASFSTAHLANAYIYDVTNGVYLWKGYNVE